MKTRVHNKIQKIKRFKELDIDYDSSPEMEVYRKKRRIKNRQDRNARKLNNKRWVA